MKKINYWYNLLYDFRIIKSKKELTLIIKREDGSKVTPTFITNVISGKAKAPQYFYDRISEYYIFTTKDYFKGSAPVIDYQRFLDYLNIKHELKRKDVFKDVGIPAPVVSKYSNATPIEKWQFIFDFYNKNYDYNIYLNTQSDDYKIKKQYTSPEVKNLMEIVDYLIDEGMVTNYKSFAESIGISQQLFANLRYIKAKQDVTKEMLVNISKKYPLIDMEYILGTSKNMLKSFEKPLKEGPEILIKITHLEENYKKLSNEVRAIKKKMGDNN